MSESYDYIVSKVVSLTENYHFSIKQNIYRETLRQLLSVFGNIYYLDGTGDRVKVKCTTGKPDRPTGKDENENNLVLPYITITEIGSEESDDRRRVNSLLVNEKIWDEKENRAKRYLSLAPRAINISYQINIWAKFNADLDQIRYAIFTLFNPSLDIRTKFSDYTKAFVKNEADINSQQAGDTTDKLVQKTITISVETYLPSPKFLFTNTGEIKSLNAEVILKDTRQDATEQVTDIGLGGDIIENDGGSGGGGGGGGITGPLTLSGSLDDVNLSSVSFGDVLLWNGDYWVASAIADVIGGENLNHQILSNRLVADAHPQYASSSVSAYAFGLSSTLGSHIGSASVHFTSGSLSGAYVLTSTNSNLSSLVSNIQASTISLSSYISANEGSWLAGGAGATYFSSLLDVDVSSNNLPKHGDMVYYSSSVDGENITNKWVTLESDVNGLNYILKLVDDGIGGLYPTWGVNRLINLEDVFIPNVNFNANETIVYSSVDLGGGNFVFKFVPTPLPPYGFSEISCLIDDVIIGDSIVTDSNATNLSISSPNNTIIPSGISQVGGYKILNLSVSNIFLSSNLQDVNVTSVSQGDSLVWDGSYWIPSAINNWQLSTLNANYLNASGDSANAGFYLSSVSATDISATNYYNLPSATIVWEQAQDIVLLVKSNVTIPKGTPVTVVSGTGSNSDIPLVQILSSVNNHIPEAYGLSNHVAGLAKEEIQAGGTGYIIVEGLLKGYDTITPGWNSGDFLYVSSNGQLSNQRPPAPYESHPVGIVIRTQQNNGSILVKIENSPELNDIVGFNLSQTILDGDLITYDLTTSTFVNKQTVTVSGLGKFGTVSATTVSAGTLHVGGSDGIIKNNNGDIIISATNGIIRFPYGLSAASVSTTTYTGLPSSTALWNANQLQGRDVLDQAPNTGQVLTWNVNRWEPSTVSTGTGSVTNNPGGSTQNLQYNSGGSFGGASSVNYITASDRLEIKNLSALNVTAVNLTNDKLDNHIASADVHFTSGSLSGYYAASSWTENRYVLSSTNNSLSSLVSNIQTSSNNLSGVVGAHIASSDVHFTSGSLSGAYVLSSTNINLSSLVSNIEASTVGISSIVNVHINDSTIHFTSGSLSGYYAASSWVNANYSPTSHNHIFSALSGLSDTLITSPSQGQSLVWSSTRWVPSSVGGGAGVTSHSQLTGLDANDHPQYASSSVSAQIQSVSSYASGVSSIVNSHINDSTIHFTSGSLSGYYAGSAWTDSRYVLTSINSALSSQVNSIEASTIGISSTLNAHIGSAVHWNLETLNSNYLNSSGDSVNASFYLSGLSATNFSATTYLNLPSGAAVWNANQLQGRNVSSTAPDTSAVLVYNGLGWTPAYSIFISSTAPDNSVGDNGDLYFQYGDDLAVSAYILSATNYLNLPTSSLSGLLDTSVTVGNIGTGKSLVWNGSKWIPSSVGGGTGTTTAAGTTTEIQFRGTDGVFSSIPGFIWNPNLYNGRIMISGDAGGLEVYGSLYGSNIGGENITLYGNGTTSYSKPGPNNSLSSTAIITPNLSATTISATTYQNLPVSSLSGLADVQITGTPTTNYVLKWNGTKWTPAVDATGTGGGLANAYAVISDGANSANAAGADTLSFTSLNSILSINLQSDGEGGFLDNLQFTVNQDQIGHGNLNAASLTTGDPHTQYALKSLSSTAYWNANKIQGVDVSAFNDSTVRIASSLLLPSALIFGSGIPSTAQYPHGIYYTGKSAQNAPPAIYHCTNDNLNAYVNFNQSRAFRIVDQVSVTGGFAASGYEFDGNSFIIQHGANASATLVATANGVLQVQNTLSATTISAVNLAAPNEGVKFISSLDFWDTAILTADSAVTAVTPTNVSSSLSAMFDLGSYYEVRGRLLVSANTAGVGVQVGVTFGNGISRAAVKIWDPTGANADQTANFGATGTGSQVLATTSIPGITTPYLVLIEGVLDLTGSGQSPFVIFSRNEATGTHLLCRGSFLKWRKYSLTDP